MDASGWDVADPATEDGWGLGNFLASPAPAVGYSPRSPSSPSPSSSDQSLDQFDSMFAIAHDVMLLLLVIIFVLVFYSWVGQPRLKELDQSIYSFASSVCEPHVSAKRPRKGFGDLYV